MFGFPHILFTGISAAKAVTSWGDIVYPNNRKNKHTFAKNDSGKEDFKYKSFLWTKAVAFSGLSVYFGCQFFKNFKNK